MSQVRRIARNTLVTMLGNAVAYAFGFFFTMYVARYLGAQGYGVLAFAIAFTAIFGIFTDIGMFNLISRQVARDETLAQKYIANVGALKLFLNAAVFGLIALTVSLLDYPSQTTFVIYLVGASVVFTSFTQIFYGVFRGNERMEYSALALVVVSAANLGGALYVIRCGYGVVGIAIVYAASSLAALLLTMTICTLTFAKPRLELDIPFLKEAMREAWPFALTSFLYSTYYWTDTVVISFIKGDEAVGWYNAAYRLLYVLTFIPIAYFGATFPVMSRLHISSPETLRFTYERSMKYMLILGLPIGVGATLLADRIIAQIFGADFSSSVLALRILVWAVVLQLASGVFTTLFDSTNRQRTTALLIGISALSNLILDLILTPIYNIYGAAAATLGNAALLLVLGYTLSSKSGYRLSSRTLLGTMARVMAASAAMALFVIYFDRLSMYILIPVGAIIYFAVICLVHGFDKEDLILVSQIIRGDGPDNDQAKGGSP